MQINVRAIEFLLESKITLQNLYGGNFPDRGETFWDYVRPGELNNPLDIKTLPKYKLAIMLQGQYRVEHLDEILDMMDEDQKEILQRYIDDPNLSKKTIVISGDRIIDGNHRALAAAMRSVPINYVDLADLDEQGVSEGSLNEYRDRMYQYIKSIVPGFPDYVVKDWLYANLARGATQGPGWSFDTIGKDIPNILKDIGLSVDTKWQLVPNMKFTMDMWEPKTLKRLQARAGGVAGVADDDVHIPARDAERHATQAQLAQQQGGVRKEPVILIKTSNGYALLEGWHRTIQHFHKFPDGYTGPAYVAVAQGQQGVAEDREYIRGFKKRTTYNGIDLVVNIDGAKVDIRAMAGDNQMAYVVFDRDGDTLAADDLAVDDQYKGQGIAKIMYDYVKELGFKVKRSSDQTGAGKSFWDRNKGVENSIWEQNTEVSNYAGL